MGPIRYAEDETAIDVRDVPVNVDVVVCAGVGERDGHTGHGIDTVGDCPAESQPRKKSDLTDVFTRR